MTLKVSDLDQILIKQANYTIAELNELEKQKPVRKAVDKYLLPAGTATVAGALATAKALSNIQTNPRLVQV